MTKIFFQIMLNGVLKMCEKWYLYLTNFYKKYLQNLKYNAKMMCMFHLIMVSIPSSLIFSAKNRVRVCMCVCVCYGRGRGVGVVLNRQNPLSVTKVICQWSLILILEFMRFIQKKESVIFSFERLKISQY